MTDDSLSVEHIKVTSIDRSNHGYLKVYNIIANIEAIKNLINAAEYGPTLVAINLPAIKVPPQKNAVISSLKYVINIYISFELCRFTQFRSVWCEIRAKSIKFRNSWCSRVSR